MCALPHWKKTASGALAGICPILMTGENRLTGLLRASQKIVLILLGALALFWIPTAAATPSDPPATTDLAFVRERLAKSAPQLTFFETAFLVSNRPPLSTTRTPKGIKRALPALRDLYTKVWPESLAQAHAHMLDELRSVGSSGEALAALLKDSDPQIRTLALGALFLREDAHDLPLIATLFTDNTPFGRFLTWWNRKFTVTPRAQTVGAVARATCIGITLKHRI